MTVALDTAGTWLTTNGIGLNMQFATAMGTNYHNTAGSWHAGNYISTSNQVNNMDSVSNYFRITDVKLEIGSAATEFMADDYEVLLAKCKRYFYRLGAATNALFEKGYNSAGAYSGPTITHHPEMRVAPTITKTGTFTVSNCGQPGWGSVTPTSGYIQTLISGTAAYSWYSSGAAQYVSFDAELA